MRPSWLTRSSLANCSSWAGALMVSARAPLRLGLTPHAFRATFIALSVGGGTINTMILGGLALVFSRLIDNSVVVLENIFRHLEMGTPPREAAERGVRLLIVCFIAAVAIAMLLLDRPTTIAADDNDTPISKSASATGFAGHAWAR